MKVSLAFLLRKGSLYTRKVRHEFLWIKSGYVTKACAMGAMGLAYHCDLPDKEGRAVKAGPEDREKARNFQSRDVLGTLIDRSDFPPASPLGEQPASKVPLRTVIMNLNDEEGMTRLAIAEWLRSIENKYDLFIEEESTMTFDCHTSKRARQGQVEEHFMEEHGLDSCPSELTYAVEEVLESRDPDSFEELCGLVRWVFQCEWDASIPEFVPIWEERGSEEDPREPLEGLAAM